MFERDLRLIDIAGEWRNLAADGLDCLRMPAADLEQPLLSEI